MIQVKTRVDASRAGVISAADVDGMILEKGNDIGFATVAYSMRSGGVFKIKTTVDEADRLMSLYADMKMANQEFVLMVNLDYKEVPDGGNN